MFRLARRSAALKFTSCVNPASPVMPLASSRAGRRQSLRRCGPSDVGGEREKPSQCLAAPDCCPSRQLPRSGA